MHSLRVRSTLPLLRNKRAFSVLALESSADDTCAAIVTSNREILSNVVIKQNTLHREFGGIHPYIAIEAHQRNMPTAIRRALAEADMNVNDIDGIAYTRGPGIGGCLSVGSNAAKNLASALNKPLVGVHHMQAHALTPFLTSKPDHCPEFPFLTLLISGGHTLLLLAKSVSSFETLATTTDQSIGRAFDKVSRLLGLSWGHQGLGAALEQFCAEEANNGHDDETDHISPFPGPMHGQLAFSYTGLHSSVERYIHSRGGLANLNVSTRRALARAFQHAAVLQLEEKLHLALNWCKRRDISIRHVIVSGGVASNAFVRHRLENCVRNADSAQDIMLLLPPQSLCTDNAAMIAWASMHRFHAKDYDDYAIELRARWKIEDLSA